MKRKREKRSIIVHDHVVKKSINDLDLDPKKEKIKKGNKNILIDMKMTFDRIQDKKLWRRKIGINKS